MMHQVRIVISGRVQGVGFRYFVKEKANELGLAGWVRNTEDEKVEVLVEGWAENIDTLIAHCQKGPPLGEVKNVAIQKKRATGQFKRFDLILF